MRPGRVYAYSAEDLRLLISEDEGATWREFILERQPSFLATHPADPDYIYLGNLTIRDERNTRPGFLLHSADGGRTWRRRDLDRIFNSISPDPLDASGLYDIARNELLHSPDQGQTWQPIAIPAEEAIRAVYAPAPDVLYVQDDPPSGFGIATFRTGWG